MILSKGLVKYMAFFLVLQIVLSSAQAHASMFNRKPAPADSSDVYRGTAPKINDLVNTRLDVHFDYAKHFLYGKEWVTLKPHFYATDSLSLDAKGMDIHTVSLVNKSGMKPLVYTYDSKQLKIKLPVSEKSDETYMVYIDYTAKPDQLKHGGSAAITNDKGLYFINTDKKDPEKPVEIWTQGETESSSCWFPTIDKPNQKTTDEISMTVPDQYVTLSNGKLELQKKNGDGTRTDTWKMDLPHAPYLIMMAVGDFQIYKDHWRDKEVSYYLEPKYAPYAKQIFGNTPEIIDFYSKILGVDYPWNKYSQIVVRDYVSGAMENTTATLHGESVQRTAKDLLDDNQEDYISHELFHQWFGDYVTCESWSNITVNESFAACSEILWNEHKYGRDKADADRLEKLKEYLNLFPSGASPELVRFHYKSREDVFDVVSYNKGAVILYMLRDMVGQDAFYKALHIYLVNNAFKSAEASQLRLAFEEATGKDLNWFWNQWYYKGGHPILTWSDSYDAAQHILKVKFSQIQDSSIQTFRLPLNIDFSNGTKTISRKILITDRNQEFTFKLVEKPELINPDPDHILVGEIRSSTKDLKTYHFQYSHSKDYINRYMAIDTALKSQTDPMSAQILLEGLRDENAKLRKMVIEGLSLDKPETASKALPLIEKIATDDPINLTKSAAIEALSKTGDSRYAEIFKKGLQSESPAVEGASLKGLASLDPKEALQFARKFENESSTTMIEAIGSLYSKGGLDEHAPFFEHIFNGSADKFTAVFLDYLYFLVDSKNTEIVRRGITLISKGILTLHNKNFTESLQKSFENMGRSKTAMAVNTFDPNLKEAYRTQAAALEKASDDLKKASD